MAAAAVLCVAACVLQKCGRAAEAAESVNCAHADRCTLSLSPFLQAINPGGWTRTQEVSNGRAAIAGLVAAFIAEKTVHTSAFDQLFGAAGGAPWAKPLFFAVVAVFIGITATGVLATAHLLSWTSMQLCAVRLCYTGCLSGFPQE